MGKKLSKGKRVQSFQQGIVEWLQLQLTHNTRIRKNIYKFWLLLEEPSPIFKHKKWLIISSFSIWCCIRRSACSQSLTQVNTSTISGVKQVLRSSIILPAVLNACSEETVETGIDKTSRANMESIGNVLACDFHHCKISSSSPSLCSKRVKSVSR